MFKGVSFTDPLKNDIGLRNVSLGQFLFFLNIADIAQQIENNFYGDKDWHFRYNVSAMIKFAIVKFFRQQPFKKIVLSNDEALLLGFEEGKDAKLDSTPLEASSTIPIAISNHADIWYKLKAKPLISLPVDAAINYFNKIFVIIFSSNYRIVLFGFN